jgi:hypothetical protein
MGIPSARAFSVLGSEKGESPDEKAEDRLAEFGDFEDAEDARE